VTVDQRIIFEDVSKFYGEVLGVNQINLEIEPGITSLVGPNGSGKTTLMNLTLGLLRPTEGRITVVGDRPSDAESFFRKVGYCSQYDSFPRGLTGRQFLQAYLRLYGLSATEVADRAASAIARVGLEDAADRRVAGYSKGMRQRIKLAQALAHDPQVLILDEPLNGLDPMARAEVIELLRDIASQGQHLVISSHILHEVDMISDTVILLNSGYVVAEGEIQALREEIDEHPLQILIRCDRPSLLASRIFQEDHAVEIKIHEDHGGLHVRTTEPSGLYLLLNRVVLEEKLKVESVAPSDDDVHAVYEYLIGNDGEVR
jgi:ABC-2 type transport system ATP-binding protein